MKLLNGTGLVRVEKCEWPEVKARLLATGKYVWHQGVKGCGNAHAIWNAARTSCLSQWEADDGGCYYLDARVLPDLAPEGAVTR